MLRLIGRSLTYQSRRYLAAPAENKLVLTLASPGQVYYNQKEVYQVDIPGLNCDFGVLAQHVPTLSCLKPGVLSVTELDNAVKKYFVSSGSVTVNEDSTIQVLAEEAHTLDKFDIHLAKEGLSKAQQGLSAGTDVAKAEAQVEVECYEAIIKALEGHKH